MLRIVWPLALLAGCPDPNQKDTGGDEVIEQGGDTDEETCEGTNPVLSELTVENFGMYEFEGEESPALKVTASGDDDDGDLHDMNLQIWWDDVVDGAVDTSSSGVEGGFYAMGDTDCGTFSANYNLLLEVDGDRFEYGVAYEFAAVIFDAAGLDSGEPVIASGVAPNADGTDG